MKIIDCRGLKCPEPVLKTKSAIIENPNEELNITVDSDTARENVLRLIRSMDKKAVCIEADGTFTITVTGDKAETIIQNTAAINNGTANDHVLFISTDQLGQGSTELGLMLMRNFIYTLTRRDHLPSALVLMNSGVKLSIKGSPVLDELKDLESKNVLILVCGTCIDYYELKALHQVGQVSNMYDIADLLLTAQHLVTI